MKQKHVSMQTQTLLDCRQTVHTISFRSDFKQDAHSVWVHTWPAPWILITDVIICTYHLIIFTSSSSSCLHTHTSLHPDVSSCHLHILPSWRLRIFTPSHLFSASSHLRISHLHTFKSKDLILTSSHPFIFTPTHLTCASSRFKAPQLQIWSYHVHILSSSYTSHEF